MSKVIQVGLSLPEDITEAPAPGVFRCIAEVDVTERTVEFYCSRSDSRVASLPGMTEDIVRMVESLRSERMAAACDAYDRAGHPDGENTIGHILDAFFEEYGVDDLLHCLIVLEFQP